MDEPPGKPLKVMAFDEARFGLINWHHRRYSVRERVPCAPRGVRRRYERTYFYAAAEPTSGESFCSYMPGMDGRCLEAFLEHLGEAYSDYHLVLS